MIEKIIQIGHPTLREKARPLTTEEIVSSRIQTLISAMIATMHSAPGVGLAAPQIGEPLQIIVIEDKPEYTFQASKEQLELKQRKPIALHVLINPLISFKYEDQSHTKLEFFEGCLSIEGFVCIVPRFQKVEVTALNEKAEPVKLTANGWYARILQHEIDHLNGILCIDRMKQFTMITYDNYVKYWLDKPIDEFYSDIAKLET